MNYGSKIWIFPDAECPPEGVNSIPGHESIIITNTCDHNAHIKFTLFFTDKDPVQLVSIRYPLTNNMRLCWKVIGLLSHNMAELIREL